MCLTIPGRVTQVQGAMAEVESGGQREWYNALAQPDVKVDDYVLTHANLIVAIISQEEAQRMQEAADEVERRLQEEQAAESRPPGSSDSNESGT
jgi:hydrogenase assembly chaperone HypC/HupF